MTELKGLRNYPYSLRGEFTEDDDGEVILPHVANGNGKATGLEWDDSTSLKNSTTKSTHKSQTYRV